MIDLCKCLVMSMYGVQELWSRVNDQVTENFLFLGGYLSLNSATSVLLLEYLYLLNSDIDHSAYVYSTVS